MELLKTSTSTKKGTYLQYFCKCSLLVWKDVDNKGALWLVITLGHMCHDLLLFDPEQLWNQSIPCSSVVPGDKELPRTADWASRFPGARGGMNLFFRFTVFLSVQWRHCVLTVWCYLSSITAIKSPVNRVPGPVRPLPRLSLCPHCLHLKGILQTVFLKDIFSPICPFSHPHKGQAKIRLSLKLRSCSVIFGRIHLKWWGAQVDTCRFSNT